MVWITTQRLMQVLFMQIIYLQYVRCKEEIDQIPRSASAAEGSTFSMTCEYNTAFFSLQWYKQVPGEKFQFLRTQRSDEEITEDRFVFRLQKEKKLSTFSIKQVEVSDSATYWCALEAQC
ncbi:hypothetical protein XELAEV_18007246mg [Xenopus laevis]|uniref:Ig-like domain-containing protein n=1 Tax=Xenopus laevis TaxID=8355 RepID=A0A974E060_XENLA|nr:hypothetical protein XELAEV_18007246mg [Xenopus laevis]